MFKMIDYLDELESEAIYILREVAGQFEKPALLFSGGKDSITLVHLALKAFRPGKFPFPLVHIDTGHNFQRGPGLPRPPGKNNRRETHCTLGGRYDP